MHRCVLTRGQWRLTSSDWLGSSRVFRAMTDRYRDANGEVAKR